MMMLRNMFTKKGLFLSIVLLICLPTTNGYSETFSKSWEFKISDPFSPLSVSVLAERGLVVVGSRDCPDNTKSVLQLLNASNGELIESRTGVSEISVGHDMSRKYDLLKNDVESPCDFAESRLVVTGLGWDKPEGTTLLAVEIFNTTQDSVECEYDVDENSSVISKSSQNRFTHKFHADTSMWSSVSTSEDNKVAAVLIEPSPDAAHINNRSGTLAVLNTPAAGEDWLDHYFEMTVAGLIDEDPQTVVISANGNSDSLYTVGALIGDHTFVVDYDSRTGKGETVYHGRQQEEASPEIAIAVGADGKFFAVGNGSNVDVFQRSTENQKKFRWAQSLKAPVLGMTPVTMATSSTIAHHQLLAITWGSGLGDVIATTAHVISSTDITLAWQFVDNECEGSFTDVVNNGLAVSARGEFVVVGSWGCPVAANEKNSHNLRVFDGISSMPSSSAGIPIFNASLNGQIWAIDIDMKKDGRQGLLAVGTWAQDLGENTPSMATVFTF